jgi:enoyl-CoA hydratase
MRHLLTAAKRLTPLRPTLHGMPPSPGPSIDSFVSEVLAIEVDGPVATLWLDRPDKRNALGPAFWSDLPKAMAAIGSEPEVRAIVVAARGPHFSVGLDLVAMSGLTGSTNSTGGTPPSMASRARSARAEILRLQASVTSVAESPLPVIAAIHGYCIGGGVDLAVACDIRLASADSLFSVRETKVAIVADLGSLQRLPHIIGKGHLAELAYTGKDITAARAESIGLVNQVSADSDAVLRDARAMAAEIAANSPLAVQGTKAVLRAGEGKPVEEGLEFVATWNAGFLASDDLTEAMTAFMEKRPAVFTGN